MSGARPHRRSLHVVPPQFSPYNATKSARLAADAGWPPDAVNAVGADADFGTVFRLGSPRWRRSLEWRLRAVGHVLQPFSPTAPLRFHLDDTGPLRRLLDQHHYEVIHYHGLDGALAAARVARGAGSRFVVDFWENYPSHYWSTGSAAVLSTHQHSYDYWMTHERAVVAAASAVIVKTTEMRSRLVGEHAVDPAKIHVVENTERAEDWPSRRETGSSGRDLRLIFAGGCSPIRGLDTIVRAIALVRPSGIGGLELYLCRGFVGEEPQQAQPVYFQHGQPDGCWLALFRSDPINPEELHQPGSDPAVPGLPGVLHRCLCSHHRIDLPGNRF